MAELPKMRVGLVGPVSLDLLEFPDGPPDELPPGYPAPIVAHYANALLRRGHSVNVFTTSRGPQMPVIIDQGSLVVCIAPRYKPRSAIFFYSRERRWLRELIRRFPCDLLHAMWSYEFALAALQCDRRAIVHYRDHAWTILKHRRDTYRLLRWLLNRYVTWRSLNRVANSAYLRQALGQAGRGMPVLPNFLPQNTLIPDYQRPDGGDSVIVTISNGFSGRKNIPLALQAFQGVRQKGLVREYRLVGHGMEPMGEAQRFAIDNDLDQGVTFIGPLPYDKTMGEVGRASLLLHPALEESFGMTILEAMALMTPVIAGYGTGNVPELLDHGECGYLCDVTDSEDIESSIQTLLASEQATLEITHKARQRFLQYYSERALMDTLEEYYARVLQDGDRLYSGVDP